MEERDWSTFACPNPDCSTFGQRGGDNLRQHGWSSKARNIRCLRCTACGRHFSERAGTPLFRSHLTEDQAVQIARPLAEGHGVRPTSRLGAVSLNTASRLAARAGGHAQASHDTMVRHVAAQPVQADEAWPFVGEKR